MFTRSLLFRQRVRKVVEMGVSTNVAPVIIKRKKVIVSGGHHGGAWKVAYADFVTAMMAFFMLMWLLGATTEKQRKGIADYFSPTISVSRVSGGGEGVFGGDDLFSQQSLHQGGASPTRLPAKPDATRVESNDASGDSDKETFANVQGFIFDPDIEVGDVEELRKHISARITDEGLIVEVFSSDDNPLFEPDSDKPRPILQDLARIIASAASRVENGIALDGHVSARPVVMAVNPVWDLSAQLSNRMRLLLKEFGLAEDRARRVTGHADRDPVSKNPMSMRNDRIEVIFLRD